MASLTNTKIKNTYVSLLKVADNGQLDATLQDITDGAGNVSGIQLNTGGDLTASGTVSFGSLKDSGENITITKFVDAADGIGSNDNDTTIPTSAAVKLYVDTNVTAQDLDFATDSGTGAVDLDSQTFSILGTANEIETSGTGQTVTIGLPSSITVDVTGNLTGNVSGNVTGNVTGNLTGNVTGDVTGDLTGNVTATSVLVDGVTATTQSIGDNSTKVATTAYVDAAITNEGLDFAGDSGTGTIDLDSEVFTIAGTANEIETSATGNSLIVGLPSNVTIGNDLTVTGAISGTLSTAAQPNITSVGTLSSLTVSGNLIVDTNTLYVDAANNSVGFGTTSPSADAKIHVLDSGTPFASAAGTVAVFQRSGASFSGAVISIIGGNGGSSTLNFGDTDDENVGYINYVHTDNYLSLGTNAGEKLRIDSSGRVGIGTSSPDYNLEITSSSAPPTLLLGQTPYTTNGTFLIEGNQLTSHTDASDISTVSVGASRYTVGNGIHQWYTSPSTSAGFARTFTERMRIDSDGNVGIGVTVPYTSAVSGRKVLDIGGTTDALLAFTTGGTTRSYLYQSGTDFTIMNLSTAGGNFIIGNNGSEKMRIDSAGRVLVGGTTAGLSTTDCAQLWEDGRIISNSSSGGGVLYLNRSAATDGTIASFYRNGTQVGSIESTDGTDLQIGSGNCYIRFDDATNEYLPTNAVGVKRDNIISLGASDARIKDIFTSGSVYLGGTAAANALDDYEEGTWTPVYAPSSGTFTTMTMDVLSATYTKIGRKVTAIAYFRTDNVNITGGSGSMLLNGLPFANRTSGWAAVSLANIREFATEPTVGYVGSNETSIRFQKDGGASGHTDALTTDFTTGAVSNANQMMVTATYFTA